MVFGFSTAAIGGLRLALRARPCPKLTFKHVGPEGNYGRVGADRLRRLTLCLGTAGLRRRFPRERGGAAPGKTCGTISRSGRCKIGGSENCAGNFAEYFCRTCG